MTILPENAPDSNSRCASAIPSIVSGLFIYAFWLLTLGFQKTALAGALSLVMLMLPIVVRSTDAGASVEGSFDRVVGYLSLGETTLRSAGAAGGNVRPWAR